MLANALTVLRIIAAPGIIVLGYFREPVIVAIAIGLLALTDVLDGWVARSTKISRLGELLDPAADKVLALCTVVTLVSWFGFSVLYAVLVLLRDIAVIIFVGLLVAFKKASAIPTASVFGKATTFLQNLALLAALFMLGITPLLVWSAAVVGAVAVVEYVWGVRRACNVFSS